jgi:hypothetical protein
MKNRTPIVVIPKPIFYNTDSISFMAVSAKLMNHVAGTETFQSIDIADFPRCSMFLILPFFFNHFFFLKFLELARLLFFKNE